MNKFISIAAVLAMLLAAGGLLGLRDRARFAPRWLAVAAGLVLLNDALLTRGWGTLPNLIPGGWNWQGMALSLAATLAIAALPAFGWRRVGLTLAQAPGSLRPAVPVAIGYGLFFLAIALVFPGEPADGETIAFQLTMPGLAEEVFYRGLLLFALDRALAGRVRFLGVDWGWGALLSCAVFGLDHAFGYGRDGFAFEPIIFALTAIPSLIAVWLRYRTGSVALPVVLHNFGNAIGLLI